jgi:hypothetical protein
VRIEGGRPNLDLDAFHRACEDTPLAGYTVLVIAGDEVPSLRLILPALFETFFIIYMNVEGALKGAL